MDLVADTDTIQSQLAKPKPNSGIIMAALNVVKGAATINGCATFVEKVGGLKGNSTKRWVTVLCLNAAMLTSTAAAIAKPDLSPLGWIFRERLRYFTIKNGGFHVGDCGRKRDGVVVCRVWFTDATNTFGSGTVMQAIRIRIQPGEVHLYIISAVAHGAKGTEEIVRLGKIKGGKYQVFYDDPQTSYPVGELDVPNEPSGSLPTLTIPKLEAPILKPQPSFSGGA